MQGEFNFKKFAAFLKSFWGILAAFTVILPTIIYFANANQIKNSILSDYYVGIPTTFALLVIPFIFLYENKLSSLQIVRKASIIFIILSFFTLFSFLTLKSIYIYNVEYNEITITGEYKEITKSKRGEVRFKTFQSKTDKHPQRDEQTVNILELISLILYSLSIIFLTTSFSGIGVFFYTKSQS